MTNFSPIRKASAIMADRYYNILEKEIDEKIYWEELPNSLAQALKMCATISDENIEMYDDKVSRWLGFIQGVMFMNGIIYIDDERDVSRPLFHKAYEDMGLKTPDIIDLKD